MSCPHCLDRRVAQLSDGCAAGYWALELETHDDWDSLTDTVVVICPFCGFKLWDCPELAMVDALDEWTHRVNCWAISESIERIRRRREEDANSFRTQYWTKIFEERKAAQPK